MKPLVGLLAVGLIVAAACSESALPTATRFGLKPRFELAVLQGGCPTPFTLGSIYDGDGAAVDRNGDGLACYLRHTRTDGDFESVFGITWTDNNVPLSQIGGCPNGFDLRYLIAIDDYGERDVNGDRLVCTKVSGNGSTIVIDNNHRN